MVLTLVPLTPTLSPISQSSDISHAERAAVNFVIQGSAADICKAAMVVLQKGLEDQELKARLLLQVHDELVLGKEANWLDQRIILKDMSCRGEEGSGQGSC